jgi:hypothetical protein
VNLAVGAALDRSGSIFAPPLTLLQASAS